MPQTIYSKAGADAAIAAAVAGLGRASGAQSFVAKADMKSPSLVAAAAGDSTGDEISEWIWRGFQMWLADRTDMSGAGYYGYGDTGPYTQANIQTGTGVGTWTAYFDDTFSRTVADIFGSTPDVGNVYGGGSGVFSADGNYAISGGSANGITQDAGSGAAGGRRRLVADIEFDTTTGAASSKVFSMSLGTNSTNLIQMRLQVATDGTQTCVLNKIVGGTVTQIASFTNPLDVATVSVKTVSIELNGTTVTGTVGSSTQTATLSSSEQAAVVDGAFRVYFQTIGAASSGKIKVNRIHADKYATGSARAFTLYNGSRAGSILQYQLDRLTSLYPTSASIDLLLVSSSHNYALEPTPYLAAVDAFLTAYKALHPESGILICSQNPEFSPVASTTSDRHLRRLAALRAYATQRGYGYLPVAEHYVAQSDGGASWVQSDGIHPKRATEAADPANGSYQTALLFRNHLNSLSLSA